MASDPIDSVVYQYLLVEMQGARTNILGLWSSSIALTILFIASLFGQAPGAGLIAGLFVVVLLFFLLKYLIYLAAVKGLAKSYAAGSRPGSLRDGLRLDVLPKEVAIPGFRPKREGGGAL
jgi:hypothetical protein